MSSDGIKWQPIDGKDADSRMCRTYEATELCRTEGAEIPVLSRVRMKQAQLNDGKQMFSRFF